MCSPFLELTRELREPPFVSEAPFLSALPFAMSEEATPPPTEFCNLAKKIISRQRRKEIFQFHSLEAALPNGSGLGNTRAGLNKPHNASASLI